MLLSVSPCSRPDLTLEQTLSAFGEIGYERIELFTSWAKSAVDPSGDPDAYFPLLGRHGFSVSSMHLPPMDEDLEESLRRAAQACRFAVGLGCPVVLVKARARELYRAGTPRLLDLVDELPVTPVLQNHKGTAISTLEDYAEVLDAIDDPRIKCVLEVGQFHSVGVPWRAGYEALAGRIALVHIKDQIGAQSVPFGTGEIDLPGLFERLVADGYEGDVVIEMEVTDRENTIGYLKDALTYVKEHLPDGDA